MLKNFTIFVSKIILILIVSLGGIVLFLPSQAKAEDVYSTLEVMAKDPQGIKVQNVNFNVFEQAIDINGNPFFGPMRASGYIKESGLQEIKVKLNTNTTQTVVIEYFIQNRPHEKFILWNLQISPNQTQNVVLTFSSVRIVLKDASGQLLKDLPFDIYSVAQDILGNKVAKDRLYESQKTGITGENIFYFTLGDYILRIKYPGINNLNALDYLFSINKDRQTDLTYVLSDIKVSARDFNDNLKTNAEFKIYKKDNNYDYKELATLNTSSEGVKKILLPAGDYKLEFKDNAGNFNKVFEFSLASGQEREFIYSQGSFRLKVLDPDKDPIVNLRVTIYKFADDQKQSQSFWAITDGNGLIELPLISGNYLAEIEGFYGSLKYTTQTFYVSDDSSNYLEYILSKVRIYLQNSANQNYKNQVFTVYRYYYDSQGNLKTGEEIGSFSTGYQGYGEIFLPPGQYIIKIGGQNSLYPISIDSEKLNNIYLTVRENLNAQTTPDNSQQYSNPVSTVMVPDSLYDVDSDGDGLANFEEYYIWQTDPYNPDTDGDGYIDSIEIKYGYNPRGPGKYTYPKYSYGKPRVSSLSIEQDKAVYLKEELVRRIGRSLGVNAKDWPTIVNAYIYGGYTINEIKDTLVYGPGMVHPTIPAVSWRKAIQYGKH